MRRAGRTIGAALAAAGLGLALAACGEGEGSTNHTVYIEAGSGDSAIYLVSDNLDPASISDDASSHKVAGLPNGSVEVCKFTTSQGVTYKVWSTGSGPSTDLARAECYRMGQ